MINYNNLKEAIDILKSKNLKDELLNMNNSMNNLVSLKFEIIQQKRLLKENEQLFSKKFEEIIKLYTSLNEIFEITNLSYRFEIYLEKNEDNFDKMMEQLKFISKEIQTESMKNL